METLIIQFSPATGSDDEWNEAYARLADYFRSFQLHNRIRRTQLILEMLRKASEAHAKDPSKSPTAHSIEQARLAVKNWLSIIYDDMHLSESQLEGVGRLGFNLSGGPQKWSNYFLETRDLPAEMVETMRKVVTQSGPGMDVSKMTPRNIDLGIVSEVADNTFDRLDRYPLLRFAVIAIFFVIVIFYLYHLFQQLG
jgi:hypothetical protein